LSEDWKDVLRKALGAGDQSEADTEKRRETLLGRKSNRDLKRTIHEALGVSVPDWGRPKGRKTMLADEFHQSARYCLDWWFREHDKPPTNGEMAELMVLDPRTYREYKRQYGDPLLQYRRNQE
jgi:hypothetical protein